MSKDTPEHLLFSACKNGDWRIAVDILDQHGMDINFTTEVT